MTQAFAMGAPWLRATQPCGPGAPLAQWLAAMTGKRGHHGWTPHRWGGMGPGGPGFGPGGPGFAPPWMSGRGPKVRRGDVRAAILGVLAEQSSNGYQIIQAIAERTGGAWKPSPGSIYPTLQQLEDEGLVFADETSGRRAFALTDEGKRYVQEHGEEIAAPWKAFDASEDDASDVRPLIGQVAAAVWQIMAVGTPEQQDRGREALAELRRKLYGILAEGDDAEDNDAGIPADDRPPTPDRLGEAGLADRRAGAFLGPADLGAAAEPGPADRRRRARSGDRRPR